MKALILDGAPPGDDAAARVRASAQAELRALGWQTDALPLAQMSIQYCQGCFGCWTKTPGVCVLADDGREVARKTITSDLVILLTPVTFGGYSSALKREMDRMVPSISPFFMQVHGETHHRPRYDRSPRTVGIGLSWHLDARRNHATQLGARPYGSG